LTFHPSYSYEDFIEGFRPTPSSAATGLTLSLESGVFKRVCREAQAKPDTPFLLLIDEINRANVAKVFGELITLLEKDKRGLMVTLPQSKESFTIPPNVFLLDTMNTADRSIKLLDAALRRRFSFIELMPDVEPLQGAKVGGLELAEFLLALNARVAEHVGREKQIGHSFFMEDGQPVTDVDVFAERFRHEVLPLLQEYCYDDYATLARYIGNGLVNSEEQTLNADKLYDAESLVAALEDEYKSSGSDEP
jgi:5-methylcytosine-specific restriction protein B